jgi:hypothetical protein
VVSIAAKWLREQGETVEGHHDGDAGAADEAADGVNGVASLLSHNRKRTWAQVGVYRFSPRALVFLLLKPGRWALWVAL